MAADGPQRSRGDHGVHRAGQPQGVDNLDLEFEAKAESAQKSPTLYRPGRVKGTRAIVVRPNYVMIYQVSGDVVEVLRVLHAAQQWP